MNINPMDLLKNFQNIQSRINEMQGKLKDIKTVGSAGGGMVQTEMNGQMEVFGVRISPEAVDPEDIEMLQDLILASYADALAKIKERVKEEMSSITGGLDLPPGLLGL
ncbi:MAG TPA: YbaB/EbfC family nucleoid-associated protein [Spirochaetia bacterium]|nr:YbaB/EbfC family nucleoid-associated protein [Spirochaetia bacterium]